VTLLDAPGLKVPHIGWEPVRWERESRLVDGIPSATPFYFVHSFAPAPSTHVAHRVTSVGGAGGGEEVALGTAEYGTRFVCAAERGNVFGAQFHPEKSSAAGLRLLANFAAICAKAPATA